MPEKSLKPQLNQATRRFNFRLVTVTGHFSNGISISSQQTLFIREDLLVRLTAEGAPYAKFLMEKNIKNGSFLPESWSLRSERAVIPITLGPRKNSTVGDFAIETEMVLSDGYSYSPLPSISRRCCVCLGFSEHSCKIDDQEISLCNGCESSIHHLRCLGGCERYKYLFTTGLNVNIGRMNGVACPQCYKRCMSSCRRCGREKFSPNGRSAGLCDHCSVISQNDVFAYNYKPPFQCFFSSSSPITGVGTPEAISWPKENITKIKKESGLFFGIESEVECCDSERGEILEILNLPMWAFPKHDGSLRNGFEIVTFPSTWKHVTEIQMPWWKEKMGDLIANGCKSYDPGTCGLHVHLSRACFTKLHLMKFLDFFYKNPGFILAVSMRDPSQINQWATLISAESSESMAKWGRQADRKYTAVNLLHPHTVELRVFRGTLRFSTFRRIIYFVRSAWHFSHEAGITDVKDYHNYLDFISSNQEYKDILEPLKKVKISKENSSLLCNPRTGQRFDIRTQDSEENAHISAGAFAVNGGGIFYNRANRDIFNQNSESIMGAMRTHLNAEAIRNAEAAAIRDHASDNTYFDEAD